MNNSKNKKHYTILMYFLTYLVTFNIIACENGFLVKKQNNIEVYIGTLNRAILNGYPEIYRASNQRVVAGICIKNIAEPEIIKVTICEGSYCDNYDIKLLTSWYKDKNYNKSVSHDKNRRRSLVPELLVNNVDTITINHDEKTNLIKVIDKIGERYISSDEFEYLEKADSHNRIAHNASKYFVSDKNENRDVLVDGEQWMYVFERSINKSISKITLKIESKGGDVNIEIPVTTLPFELERGLVNAGIYYRSLYNKGKPLLWSENKTTEQLKIEFSDMLTKGIEYPTAYLYRDYYKYMKVRNTFDFPKDKIFLIDNILLKHLKKQDWRAYAARIQKIKNDYLFKEYEKIYFYLIDEPDRKKYENIVKHVKSIIYDAGVGIFLAGKSDNLLDNIIDGGIYILAYEPKKINADKLRLHNAKAYSYANPQIGIYMPNKMRLNYGFKIIDKGYSGIMPYAYQDSRGSQWSDMDHPQYRDHMLTYPTSDGLIQTIHGLALENAIIDMKYYAMFLKLKNEFKKICGYNYPVQVNKNELNVNKLDKLRHKLSINILTLKTKIAKCS